MDHPLESSFLHKILNLTETCLSVALHTTIAYVSNKWCLKQTIIEVKKRSILEPEYQSEVTIA